MPQGLGRQIIRWTTAAVYLGLYGAMLWLSPGFLRPVLAGLYVAYLLWELLTWERDTARQYDLRPLTRWDVPDYGAFRAELSRACNTLRMGREPEWSVMESEEPQAMAVGGRRGIVVFTTALLQQHPPEELLAIAGHEVAHLRSRDHLPALLGMAWCGMLGRVSAFLFAIGESVTFGGIFLALSLGLDMALAAVSWLAGLFLARRSRGDEHLADLAGARVTSAGIMAAALERLDASDRERRARPRLPRWSAAWLAQQLYASHPPTDVRVRFLRAAAEGGEVRA